MRGRDFFQKRGSPQTGQASIRAAGEFLQSFDDFRQSFRPVVVRVGGVETGARLTAGFRFGGICEDGGGGALRGGGCGGQAALDFGFLVLIEEAGREQDQRGPGSGGGEMAHEKCGEDGDQGSRAAGGRGGGEGGLGNAGGGDFRSGG